MTSMLAASPDTDKARRALWQTELLESPRVVRDVAEDLGLDPATVQRLEAAAAHHAFRTTRSYLALVDPDDPADPILRQLLPDPAELQDVPGFVPDAVGDTDPANHPAPGLVHKYDGRALLVLTSACAVNCRYCFRRAFPYSELRDGGPRMAAARAAIAADPSIHEVILSGGDPLAWTDRALTRLIGDLAAIPHLRRLRVHSRMPVALPTRITDGLLDALTGTRLQPWFVTHFNHPRELTAESSAACRRLLDRGIPVLNQAVLLRGVNDDPSVLAELCEGLVDIGVKPYYLHQLDRVVGTAHFEVPEDEGRQIVERLRGLVSGIAMPTWVRDLPGAASKTPLVLALALLLAACGGEPEPPVIDRSLKDVDARVEAPAEEPTPTAAPEAAPGIDEAPPAPVTLPAADRVLVADLFGDGRPEVFVAEGGDVRFGEWAPEAPQPVFDKRHVGRGMLQAWFAADLDGDRDEEVVMAFGLGRDFPKARAEIVLLDAMDGDKTIARTVWSNDGERNQITALAPWPVSKTTSNVYVGHFETRFSVRGGVLDPAKGTVDWLEGHTLRMGMARAVADFDGDGRVEVAIGRLYGEDANADGDLRVIQETGEAEMIPTRRGVRAVGAGDIDGDGRYELLFGDSWHKNYGKLARFRPRLAQRDAAGTWHVSDIAERSDNYAVEKIGIVGRAVVAGGNRTLHVYEPGKDRVWHAIGAPEPVRANGSWAALPDGRLVLSGDAVRRALPGAGVSGRSGDVPPREEKQGDGQEQR